MERLVHGQPSLHPNLSIQAAELATDILEKLPGNSTDAVVKEADRIVANITAWGIALPSLDCLSWMLKKVCPSCFASFYPFSERSGPRH